MATASELSDLAVRLARLRPGGGGDGHGSRVFPSTDPPPLAPPSEGLEASHDVIMRWDHESARNTFLWQHHPEEVPLYLESVDRIWEFVEKASGDAIAIDRAQTTLQIAMTRLELEFRHMLEMNRESVDPDWLFDPVSGPSSNAFSCSFGDITCQSSSSSGSDDDENEKEVKNEDKEEEETAVSHPLKDFCFTIPLLPPDIVPDLAGIASRMVLAGYDTECCQVYTDIRREALEESLFRLGLERITIQEAQRMQWEDLEAEMAKWVRMMRPAIRVIFGSEKQLCDQVFVGAGLDSARDMCFTDITRAGIMQLLNFGEAVAIGRRTPEKLFKILDMYETLRQLLPDLDSIFVANESVRSEAAGVVVLLGEAARGTFAAFKSAVQHCVSNSPVPGGAVHPLTRYVMNYLRLVSVYMETLHRLLTGDKAGGGGGEAQVRPEHESEFPTRDSESSPSSPLSGHVAALMDYLENNLEEASKLYKDPALPFIFLMNNVHYIVQKVRDSEVRTLLGDDWIRWRTRKVRKYHSSYQRTAWNKVVLCLKDEGIRTSGGFSSGVSKSVLRERFKSFSTAFEENLRAQTSWVVPDYQLSAELRISVGDLLLPAYRSFFGRFQSYLEYEKRVERYIKYSPEEIEASLNDLFTGSAGSSSSSGARRRNLAGQ